MDKPVVLVVEDDTAVRNLITMTLEMQEYRYRTAENGKQAIMEAASGNPDIILLDLGLPDMDGVQVIEKIRGWSSVPIVIISARTEDRDKIEALDAGADDYLTKPFSVDELSARLRAIWRRLSISGAGGSEAPVFINGNLKIDFSSGCAYMGDTELRLTPNEYRLLCILAKNAGKVLTHTYILREVWGSTLESDVASLRVFMAKLRKKLEAEDRENKYIQTHVGIGYRMVRVDTGD